MQDPGDRSSDFATGEMDWHPSHPQELEQEWLTAIEEIFERDKGQGTDVMSSNEEHEEVRPSISPIDFSRLQNHVGDVCDADWITSLEDLMNQPDLQDLPWRPLPSDFLEPRSGQYGGALTDLFTVLGTSQPTVRRIFENRFVEKTVTINLSHKLANITDIYSVAEAVDAFIHSQVEPLIREASDYDFISLSIHHDTLTGGPIYVSYHRKMDFTSQLFLDRIFRFAQSGVTRFLLDGKMTLKVAILSNTTGEGRRHQIARERNGAGGTKQDLIEIVNTHHPRSCGYLAIALGKTLADWDGKRKDAYLWRKLRAPNSPVLYNEARQLFDPLGIDIHEPLSLEKLQEVQSLFPAYQFYIVRQPTARGILKYKSLLHYVGPNRSSK